MPFRDLREFLQLLEENGELLRVTKPVEAKYEIAAYIRRGSSDDGGSSCLGCEIEWNEVEKRMEKDLATL